MEEWRNVKAKNVWYYVFPALNLHEKICVLSLQMIDGLSTYIPASSSAFSETSLVVLLLPLSFVALQCL
jgi:hypothetical protein